MDILQKLKSQIGDDVQHIFDHEALFKEAACEIARLTSEHAQLVAANQALATENARLVKRDAEATACIKQYAIGILEGDEMARAFLAGEGK